MCIFINQRTGLQCQYKPTREYCGYHDPSKYHKNKSGSMTATASNIYSDIQQWTSNKLVDTTETIIKHVNSVTEQLMEMLVKIQEQIVYLTAEETHTLKHKKSSSYPLSSFGTSASSSSRQVSYSSTRTHNNSWLNRLNKRV